MATPMQGVVGLEMETLSDELGRRQAASKMLVQINKVSASVMRILEILSAEPLESRNHC